MTTSQSGKPESLGDLAYPLGYVLDLTDVSWYIQSQPFPHSKHISLKDNEQLKKNPQKTKTKN